MEGYPLQMMFEAFMMEFHNKRLSYIDKDWQNQTQLHALRIQARLAATDV